MSKKTIGKNKTITILVLISALFILTVVCLILFLPKEINKTPQAIMECNVNPDVQFVLNVDNQVIAVNYLNNDAELLLKKYNFEGKSADQAAQQFVKLCTEAGYIDVQTSGTRVDVNISCETPSDFTEMKTKITNTINAYFDENGVIAGAVTSVSNNLKTAMQKIGISAGELADKTVDEALVLLSETSDDLDGIALSLQNDYYNFLATLKTTFATMFNQEDVINNLKTRLNESNLSQETKDLLNTQLSSAEKSYNELKKDFENRLNEEIKRLRELSITIYNNHKNELQTRIEAQIAIHQQHKTSYLENVQQTQNAIAEYRRSLTA